MLDTSHVSAGIVLRLEHHSCYIRYVASNVTTEEYEWRSERYGTAAEGGGTREITVSPVRGWDVSAGSIRQSEAAGTSMTGIRRVSRTASDMLDRTNSSIGPRSTLPMTTYS